MDQCLSLITLGVGDVSRVQALHGALGWHLDGAWRPCARRRPDQPRVAANQRVPGGLVAGAKAAASWDTGLTARPSPGTRGPPV
jgi:hypothetical protein